MTADKIIEAVDKAIASNPDFHVLPVRMSLPAFVQAVLLTLLTPPEEQVDSVPVSDTQTGNVRADALARVEQMSAEELARLNVLLSEV